MKPFPTVPAVGFDAPYELLSACHERVERSLQLLLRLQHHLEGRDHGDETSREAARDVLRYFDIAAPHHHDDEERHVLPLLRQHGQGALADRLAAEHQQLQAAYQALRPGLVALRDDGLRPRFDGWQAFAQAYRQHIALEEAEAYPPTRAASDAAALARMGAEMAARRRS